MVLRQTDMLNTYEPDFPCELVRYLMPLEFEAVGSILVSHLLDGGGCILKESLCIRQLSVEVGKDLLNRWETAVGDHQLFFQLTDTMQYLKHKQNQNQKQLQFSFSF